MERERILLGACCSVVALAIAIGGCVIHIGDGFGIHSVVWDHAAERAEQLAADLPADGTIEVRNNHGRITVEGVDGDECRVAADIRVEAHTQETADELAAAVRVEPQTIGDTLRVVTDVPRVRGSASIRVHLSIQAPRRTMLDLRSPNHPLKVSGVDGAMQLRTSNGSIAATDVAGAFTGRSANGWVQVSFAPEASAQPCRIETSNGSIACANAPGDLDVRSVNGSVRCEGIHGGARVKTSNGSIRVAHGPNAPAATVDIETVNASIDYTLPAALPGRVDIASHRGTIHVLRPLPVSVEGRIDRGVSGAVHEGAAGTRLRLKTSNGSITVR